MNGFVYAILGGNGLVKIGFSRDPFRRLNELRTDCSAHAHLVGMIAATRQQEREVHKLLAAWRHHREWFHDSGPVAVFVSMLPRPQPRIVVTNTDGWHPLAKWLFHANMTQGQAAKAMGITQGRVSQIVQGQWPSQKTAAKIARLTNHQVMPGDYVSFEPAKEVAQ